MGVNFSQIIIPQALIIRQLYKAKIYKSRSVIMVISKWEKL